LKSLIKIGCLHDFVNLKITIILLGMSTQLKSHQYRLLDVAYSPSDMQVQSSWMGYQMNSIRRWSHWINSKIRFRHPSKWHSAIN